MLGDYLRPGPAGTSLRDGAPAQPFGGLAGDMQQNVPQQMMQQGQQRQPGGLAGLLGVGSLGSLLSPEFLIGGLPGALLAHSNTGMGRNFMNWLKKI